MAVAVGRSIRAFFRMTSTAVATTDLQPQPIYADDGWYKLLERVSSGSVSAQEALSLARSGKGYDSDPHWALPTAMVHWMHARYSEALDSLVEPSVVSACDSLWLYHNLIGMVARQLPGESSKAAIAFERSIELEPNRPDTLYNFANFLKDDEPERAIFFYRRSLLLEPSAAAAWHNYGSTLLMNRYTEALSALRLSLRIDPFVADVWCNLGLAYFGLEDSIVPNLPFVTQYL